MLTGPVSSSQVEQLKREVHNLTRDIERKKLQLQKDERALAAEEEEVKKLHTSEEKIGEEIKKKQVELAGIVRNRTKREGDLKINGRKHLNSKAELSGLEQKLTSLERQVEELSRQLQASGSRVRRLR